MMFQTIFSKHFVPSDFKDGKFDGTLKIDAIPLRVTFDFDDLFEDLCLDFGFVAIFFQ